MLVETDVVPAGSAGEVVGVVLTTWVVGAESMLHHRPREPPGERGQQLRVVAQAHRHRAREREHPLPVTYRRPATTRAPSTLLSIRSDSNGWGWCGRKLQFAGDGAPSAWLGFSDWRWREYGESPIWLHFEPRYLGLLEVRVRDWCEATGRTFCVNSDGNYLPIRLLTGCEQRAVVDHVIEQLTEIHRLLRASGSAAALDRG